MPGSRPVPSDQTVEAADADAFQRELSCVLEGETGLIIDQSDTVIGTGTIVGLTCQDADAEYERLRQRGALPSARPRISLGGCATFT